MLYVFCISKELEYIEGKLETWKGVVESKELRINVNKIKIVIINPFFPNELFLYLLKVSENRNVGKGALGANGSIRKPERFPI